MKAFGAAPGIQQLKSGVGKAKVSWGILWFYFRNYYPIIFTVLWLIFCIIPFYVSDTINGHLACGSVLSLFGTCMVFLSYYHVVPWRKHPSPLILYRTLADMIFSLVLLINAVHSGSTPGENHYFDDELNDQEMHSCASISFVLQFAIFTSECWLLTFSVDLLKSLTNPFSSYQWNLKQYHLVVWTVGLLSAFALVGNKPCQGIVTAGVCWINIQGAFSGCLWGYYLAWWVLCF